MTLRRAKGLPSLRGDRMFEVVKRAIADTRREDFRIVHFSVQADHVHLLVEGDRKERLSSGIRSFVIKVALRVNRRLGRARGNVWGDRYHRRDLFSARQVRSALVYVLANVKKHDPRGNVRRIDFIDTRSSGAWFDGWIEHPPSARAGPRPTAAPLTELLAHGWRAGGKISIAEAPRGVS